MGKTDREGLVYLIIVFLVAFIPALAIFNKSGDAGAFYLLGIGGLFAYSLRPGLSIPIRLLLTLGFCILLTLGVLISFSWHISLLSLLFIRSTVYLLLLGGTFWAARRMNDRVNYPLLISIWLMTAIVIFEFSGIRDALDFIVIAALLGGSFGGALVAMKRGEWISSSGALVISVFLLAKIISNTAEPNILRGFWVFEAI